MSARAGHAARLHQVRPYCPTCGSRAPIAPEVGCHDAWHGRFAWERRQPTYENAATARRALHWPSWWCGFLWGLFAWGVLAMLLALAVLVAV